MSAPRHFHRSQRLAAVNAMLLLVILIVVLQLWLLTATVNALLAADTSVAMPAAIASLVCLALNIGLLRYLTRLQ